MQLTQIATDVPDAPDRIPLPDEAPAVQPPPLPARFQESPAPPRKRRGGDLAWLPLAAAAVCLAGGVFLWNGLGDSSRGPSAAHAARLGNRSLPEKLHIDMSRSQWPTAFNTDQPPSAGAPLLSGSLLSKQVVNDMTKTYGSYADQLQRVRILGLRFTDLRDDLIRAEDRFDRSYRKSVDTIDWTLTDWSPRKWSHLRSQARSAAEQVDLSRMSGREAQQFLGKLRARAQGRMPTPELEVLLAFNPAYVADPEQEMQDGFLQQFQGDGSGAAHGLSIRMSYPRSWMASTPTGGRTVRLFRDRRCALNVASLRVDDVPRPDVAGARDLIELYGLSDIRDAEPDAQFIAGGIVTLDNLHDCLWREFRFTRKIGGNLYRMRAVDFATVRADQYVSIGFTVGAAGSASDAALDAAYARYAPLFKTMLSSVEIAQ